MIYVSSITLNKTRIVVQKGRTYTLTATVLPENATNKNLKWTTTDSSIATVSNGVVTGKKAGSVYIEVDAMDGSFEGASCFVQVTNDVLVTKIDLDETVLNLSVNSTKLLFETVYPQNATNCRLQWSSSNEQVALVNPENGLVIAQGAGTAVITATATDGSGVSAECEVWVKGKTPVFLIHGRTSNSKVVWGINNNIPEGENDQQRPDKDALSWNGKKYIEVSSQMLGDFESDNGETDADKPYNLGNKLLSEGYKKNVNLFAFNYPNKDAVRHSALKFLGYIANLISYVRSSGTDEMKACFYASKLDYNNNKFKINIIGHSMGGLVARYYIENMNQDVYVDKLITICTPHWGSGYAEAANIIGIPHVVCDHDLDRNSAMYGGDSSLALDCNAGLDLLPCYPGPYTLTDELLYSKPRSTKYYAIAGINYNATTKELNDYSFDMSICFTTFQQITDFLNNKNLYKSQDGIDIKTVGDNVVGFLSQIGWTEKGNSSPQKSIQMEKIYIDVDTDGGNNLMDSLHNKIPHRKCVLQKVCSYLNE